MRFTDIQRVRMRALSVLGAMVIGTLLGVSVRLDMIHAMSWFAIACGLIACSILFGRFFRHRFRACLLFFGVVAISSGWTQLRIDEPKADRLDALVNRQLDQTQWAAIAERMPIEIRGVVLDPIRTVRTQPRAGDPPMWKTSKTVTRVRIDRVYQSDARGRGQWTKASGIARVIVPDSLGASHQNILGAGDRVELLGMYSPGGGARNFGEPNWDALRMQSGRVGTIVVADESMISKIHHNGLSGRLGGSMSRWRATLRVRAMNAIGLNGIEIALPNQSANTPERSVLGALLLGQRDPQFGEVYKSFQRVGVAHVLAISGFHLALVVSLGVLMIRVIGEHPKIEVSIVVSILVLGILIVPMRPPIVRAGVIVAVLLLSGRVGRRYDRLTILAWVGVGLLVWRPMDVFSLGYQLSMGITALLVVLSQRASFAVISRESFSISTGSVRSSVNQGRIGKVLGIVSTTIKTNLSCWAVAIPAIAFHAGIVSVFAPFVSLVLIPLVIVLMVVGYGQIALGVIAPGLAGHTLSITEWLAMVVNGLILWADSIPGASISIGQIGALWTVIATACIGMLVTRRVKVRSWWALTMVVGLGVSLIISQTMNRETSRLRIDMLDVGDGSCLLIQSDGHGLIWDCGSLDRRVGDSVVRSARAVGLRSIKDAVVTHDNLDHFNGLVDVARAVGLERVWISREMIDSPSRSWAAIEAQLVEMGVQIREIHAGGVIELGSVKLVCLWPTVEIFENDDTIMSGNNASIVMRIDVGVDAGVDNGGDERTVLLTGDIERPAMDAILSEHPDLHADIIELPHHGSAKPGATGFVQTIDPSLVLQSTGPGRLHDPRWDMTRKNRVWYASADRGGAWVRVMRDGRIEHGWAVGSTR